MKRHSHIMALLLAVALVLIGAGQSWAVGTAAEQVISNTARVEFTIGGNTTFRDSNTENFTVDRKIRMVVTSTGDATVVAERIPSGVEKFDFDIGSQRPA